MEATKKCPDCAELVKAEARKCRFCGYVFEQNVHHEAPPPASAAPIPEERKQLEKSPETSKGNVAATGCATIFLVLLLLFLIGKCASDTPADTGNAVATTAAAQANVQPYAVRLKREVESLRDNPRLNPVPTTKEDVMLQAAVIGARIKVYQDVPAQLSKDDEKLRRAFRGLQSSYQRDAFPKLRRAQAEALDKALWEHDVRAKAVGSRSSTLLFTGAIFASNKGIKIAQENMGDTAEVLRFKRTEYEWYPGSQSTYYSFTPLDDGVLADFIENRWVAIDKTQ